MTNGYRMGLLMGIIVGILCLIIHRLIKKNPCNYDERQILKRGKGFQYGFFTLVFYDLIFNAIYIDGTEWCDNLTGNMIGVMMALCIFGIYCIWNDAYLSLNEKPQLIYLIFGIMIIPNLLIGIFALIEGRLIQNGHISYQIINLILAIVLLLLLITFLIKNHLNNKQSQQE